MGLFARFCLAAVVVDLVIALAACGSPPQIAPQVPSASTSASWPHPNAKSSKRLRPHTTDNWIAGGGNWSNAGNWSAGTPAPNADVSITDAGGNAALDVPATVNSFTLGAGDNFTQNPNQYLIISGTTIANSGAYAIDNALLEFSSPPVTLSGGGTLTMNGANATIAFGTSFNNADNLIRGVGAYGDGTIALANGGTIEASGGTLTVQSNSSGTSNTGTLEAGPAGTLVIYSPTTQTGAGKIAALPGGIVQLHSTVIGGLVTSSGNGNVVVLAGNTNTLSDVTITGRYDVLSAGTSVWMNTIADNGTIGLGSTQALTPVQIDGTVTLTGSGKLQTSNNTGNAISPGPNGMLLNHIPIAGGGTLNVPFDNFSTIDADVKAPLKVGIPTSSTFTNSHVMEATSGGTLAIIGGVLDNRHGRITAGPGSLVSVQGTIRGGAIGTTGTGTFQGGFPGGLNGTLDGAKSPVTSGATIVVPNGTSLNLLGTIKNNSSITAAGQGAALDMTGSLTLEGTGHVTIAKSFFSGTPTETLTNKSTIQGSGMIEGMKIQNLGTIAAIDRTPLKFLPAAPALMTSGSLTIAPHSSIEVEGSLSQTGGTITLGGPMNVTTDFTQARAAELTTTLGAATPGTQYGRMAVLGTAAIDGTLDVNLTGNFIPAIGSTFRILSASRVTGKFASVSGTKIDPKEHFDVLYQPKAVELKVVKGP